MSSSAKKRGRPCKLPSERLVIDTGRLRDDQIKRLDVLAKLTNRPRDVVKRAVIDAGLNIIEKGD